MSDFEELGCNSKDPDNDKHNWPEYSENENGDEVSVCSQCGVSFFGYAGRTKCHFCHSISPCPCCNNTVDYFLNENPLTKTGSHSLTCYNCNLTMAEDFIIGKGVSKALKNLLKRWNKRTDFQAGYSQCKKDAGEVVEKLPAWADIYEAVDEIEKLEPK